jgi:thiamine biosynthesis protein ThiI
MITYLIKPGELTLKGDNRRRFENTLRRNLNALLRSLGSDARLEIAQGRYYLRTDDGAAAEEALDRLFGIAGWARARVSEKTLEAVLASCVAEACVLAGAGARGFKIEARRTDKSFPLDSYAIRCAAGDAVLAAVPALHVDLHQRSAVIQVEIREKAYVYSMNHRGRRGLPVGSAGRGLLLLSGGIDSPVAGYLMAGRGLQIEAVYFHAYPYTSDEARLKVVRLAEILGRYTQGVRLHVISFTDIQMRIRDRSPEAWTTVLLRMAMMECAEKIARQGGMQCLITGESLSQVASQTVENIACTASRCGLPVLRPLIGLDKEEIIRRAISIGTYETSILPYEDGCVLFSPPPPLRRANREEAEALYTALDLTDLIQQAHQWAS